jgi:hypothetical protein
LCVRAAPLLAAFPGSTFIDARLSKETAVLARGADVVCLFVNDDWCGAREDHAGTAAPKREPAAARL